MPTITLHQKRKAPPATSPTMGTSVTDCRSGQPPLQDFIHHGQLISVGLPPTQTYLRLAYPHQNRTSVLLQTHSADELFSGRVPALHAIEALDMNLYLNWATDGRLPTMYSPQDTAAIAPEFHWLVRMYVMGGHLQDATFQNSIIDCLFLALTGQRGSRPIKLPCAATVTYAYANTQAGDGLRRMLVHMFVAKGSRYNVEATMPAEFLLELSHGLFAAKQAGLELKESALGNFKVEVEVACDGAKRQKIEMG
ncbi:unnamed protein product [Zymoseptoria tritici ST99CH_3D1]|nr:unnamed protein product [Zymoseptoria tritici ST99CH_3D1]